MGDVMETKKKQIVVELISPETLLCRVGIAAKNRGNLKMDSCTSL
jgi:hypothetical protein